MKMTITKKIKSGGKAQSTIPFEVNHTQMFVPPLTISDIFPHPLHPPTQQINFSHTNYWRTLTYCYVYRFQNRTWWYLCLLSTAQWPIYPSTQIWLTLFKKIIKQDKWKQQDNPISRDTLWCIHFPLSFHLLFNLKTWLHNRSFQNPTKEQKGQFNLYFP